MTTQKLSAIIEALMRSEAYPHSVSGTAELAAKLTVELIETHISWVLLAGEFAYKIKKPIRNAFLDYSTLELRKHCCEEELRLNRRFASEVYLDVTPIGHVDGALRMLVAGDLSARDKSSAKSSAKSAAPVEYAVRMKRFPADALMKDRVLHGQVNLFDVQQLAKRIACFHAAAAKADSRSRFGSEQLIYSEAIDNCRDLANANVASSLAQIHVIERWTTEHFHSHRKAFCDRRNFGHVRECHGDLHLGNVVLLNGSFVPFDGIEFCEDFRWIDTLSDAAFTAMDFAASGRLDFCFSFINAYFEASGDYSAAKVLQWYLVYRAMVRAKVAALRASQAEEETHEREQAECDLNSHLALAERFAALQSEAPRIWITYGLSGSGKTMGSEQLLQRHGALRIRADVERKRLAGLKPNERVRSDDERAANLYSPQMTEATYRRLADLAESIVRTGESVIVDATCLKRWQRDLFRSVAERLGVAFHVVAFHAEHSELRQRIVERAEHGHDASDADLDVLEKQIAGQQHLEADEMQYVASLAE